MDMPQQKHYTMSTRSLHLPFGSFGWRWKENHVPCGTHSGTQTLLLDVSDGCAFNPAESSPHLKSKHSLLSHPHLPVLLIPSAPLYVTVFRSAFHLDDAHVCSPVPEN